MSQQSKNLSFPKGLDNGDTTESVNDAVDDLKQLLLKAGVIVTALSVQLQEGAITISVNGVSVDVEINQTGHDTKVLEAFATQLIENQKQPVARE